MPYFMIGTQRSGSNLLRVMINQSPDLAAPHPPHFMERLAPLLPAYGDLEDDAVFMRLIDDVCILAETNPVSWELGKIDRDALASACPERSLVAVYFRIHDLLAERNHARDWVCKSLANIHYADEIDRFGGENAKFIHLHRDGRDVALSFKKAIVGEKSSYHIARQWRDEQELALKLQQKLPQNRVISVSYADLVTQPDLELRRLCDFLETPFRDEMLEFHRSKEAINTSQAGKMWSNVQKPVMSQNVSKFKSQSDPKDIAVFEAVAGDTLVKLGYPLFSGFDEENARLKQHALETADPEDLTRREAQARVMVQIRDRLNGDGQRHVA